MYLLNYPFIFSINYNHLITHLFTQLPIPLLIYPYIYSITHTFTKFSMYLLNYPFIYSITHLFPQLPIFYSFTQLFT